MSVSRRQRAARPQQHCGRPNRCMEPRARWHEDDNVTFGSFPGRTERPAGRSRSRPGHVESAQTIYSKEAEPRGGRKQILVWWAFVSLNCALKTIPLQLNTQAFKVWTHIVLSFKLSTSQRPHVAGLFVEIHKRTLNFPPMAVLESFMSKYVRLKGRCTNMVNGSHLYSACIQSAILQYCLTFTRSYTDGGADHAR